MFSKEELSKKLIEWVNVNPEIELAILFGSYAKNKQHKNSDLDLAIACSDKLTAQQKMSFVFQIQELISLEVDLVDLRSVGQPILSRIMADGERLSGSSSVFAEIAIRNVNLNEDFLPYIERTQRERKEAFLNG